MRDISPQAPVSIVALRERDNLTRQRPDKTDALRRRSWDDISASVVRQAMLGGTHLLHGASLSPAPIEGNREAPTETQAGT